MGNIGQISESPNHAITPWTNCYSPRNTWRKSIKHKGLGPKPRDSCPWGSFTNVMDYADANRGAGPFKAQGIRVKWANRFPVYQFCLLFRHR